MIWNYATYMEAIATKLKAISHSPNSKRFNRASNISELEEVLQGIVTSPSDKPIMVIIDAPEGTIGDQTSDNYLDDQLFSFYMLKKTSLTDMSSRNAALSECKSVALKVISRMIRDKAHDAAGKTPATGMKDLDTSNIAYMTVGPLADSYHGIEVMFNRTDNANIKYNQDEWAD